eukprot:gene20026-21989_t
MMNLCFSKKSPVARKFARKKHSKASWSPDTNKKYASRRYHAGEEFTRAGDEYRSKEIESNQRSEALNGDGFRRNRYRAERATEIQSYADDNGNENSYGSGGEEVKSNKATVMVHNGKSSNTANTADSFRSSMLWKTLDPKKLPTRNEVLPTFPPNRYSIGADIGAQVCTTPVAHRRKPHFRVNLDVSHYAPNEVSVKIEERFLIAEGKHFSESDFGFETCEFYRKYPIPEGLKHEDISYRINNDGILIVTGEGEVVENQKVKHVKRSSDENKKIEGAAKLVKHQGEEKRHSSYDNVCSDEEDRVQQYASVVNKGMQKVCFGDFKLVNGAYALLVDAEDYSADDMKVKVIGNEVIVQGIKKSEVTEGNEQRIVHREFKKKYNIPLDANIDHITSRMTGEGQLKIECPKKQ